MPAGTDPVPLPLKRQPIVETNREVVQRYHEAYERANSATIGTPEFVAAMAEVRRIWHELKAAGVQPNETWRRREQDKMRERHTL